MADMTKTITPNSDQLNADDLIAGPRTIKITRVVLKDSKDQPVDVFFEGDNNKPYRPGLSMRRVMVNFWGPDSDAYAGRSMTLYCDPSITFGKDRVGGIRISHMSHLDKTMKMMLTTKRARKNEFTVLPLATNDAEEALNKANEAASKGTEAFREFFNTDFAKKHRDAIKEHLDKFQAMAAEADDEGKTLSQKMDEQSQKDEDTTPTQSSAESEGGGEESSAGEASSPTDTGVDETTFQYTEGQEAKAAGNDVDTCPYADGTDQSVNWLAGWEAGSA